MATDLITLAEYKTYVGINNTNNDAQLNTIIPKVIKLVKTYCRRTFVDYIDDTKVEYFDGGLYFPLSEFPVLSISSVEYSGDYGKTYTAITEYTDWAFNRSAETIVPLNSTGEFPILPNGYKVTYNAGYEEIPEDLKLALLDLITYYLKQDMAVKSARDAGSNTVQIEYITKNTLPSHIARVLDLYVANVN